MARLVVLLRAINVGGTSKIAMADLRTLLDELGYEDVTTVLQTGNIVLSSPKSAEDTGAEIEKAVADELGVTSRVLVRTRRQFLSVVERNPFPEAVSDGKKLHVAFLAGKPDAEELKKIDRDALLPERFEVIGKEIYFHLPNGMGRTKIFGKITDKRLGTASTLRNWNTVMKVADLV